MGIVNSMTLTERARVKDDMKTQIITLVTVTAFFNLTLGGCSKVVNVRLDEVAVDTPKRIIGVVAKSGEEETFDTKGGTYEPSNRRITGVAANGERLVVPLNELDSVRVTEPASDSLSPFSIGARGFHEYIKPKKTNEIVSVETQQSVVYKFWSGCRIDQTNRVVTGLSKSMTVLRIPFDSVAFVGVKRTDWGKTSGFIVGYAVAFTALLLYAWSHIPLEVDRNECPGWQN